MNAPAEDLKDLLESGSSNLTETLVYATNLYIGEMPKEPDLCVSLFDPSELEPDYMTDIEKPFVQVQVRGAKGDYNDAYKLAHSIKKELNDQHNVTVNGTRYIGIWLQSGVTWLGYDENHRPQFSINFRIQRAGT